jgi:hypothetical protein
MTRNPYFERLDFIDVALVVLFLLGIYTGVNLNLAKGLPIPSAPSGLAGILLLIRHAGRVREQDVLVLLGVLLLYLANTLVAPNDTYLLERIKGFIQLSYSLIIGYGIFITLVHADRRQIGRLLFILCLILFVGCMLERMSDSFRALSDAVRHRLYDAFMVYQSDTRDIDLYGGVRPKLFTSEPSAVTIGYTIFAFGWLMISPWRDWRAKLAVYFGLLGLGYIAMRGPTLTLGIVLIVPYLMILEPWRARTPRRQILPARLVGMFVLGIGLAVFAYFAMSYLFAARFEEVSSESDPSFFYRVIGPPLVAWDVLLHHPLTGSGLTGEEFISGEVMRVYYGSSMFAPEWHYDKASNVLTNYLWHHWIYLGPVWGLVIGVALTFWLRTLGVVNLAACWVTWVILGQASGAYVSPKTWFILLLPAAASILHRSQPEGIPARRRRERASIRLRTALGRS